jgi:hypothetical protein
MTRSSLILVITAGIVVVDLIASGLTLNLGMVVSGRVSLIMVTPPLGLLAWLLWRENVDPLLSLPSYCIERTTRPALNASSPSLAGG